MNISAIQIKGLKRTHNIVIKKELDFKLGDSLEISKISEVLDRNEKRLLSCGLFTLADINILFWNEVDSNLGLEVEVKEGWYIYPAPIFELADRNFNVWWKEMNFDFDRVNYGVRLDHLNLTGRKDKFKIILQTGYTRKYNVEYNYPYLKDNWGFGINFYYSENNEIGYINSANKVLFKKYADERTLLSRLRYGAYASNRINVYSNQIVRLEYHFNKVNEVVASELNSDYFPEGSNHIKYLKAEYSFNYDRTLFPTYPEGGYGLSFEGRIYGLGVGNYNNASIALFFEKHFKPVDRVLLGAKIKAKVNLTDRKVPYSNNSAIGYGSDVIRGYELYVMDGTRFTWLKTAVKLRLLDKKWVLGKYMPFKAFNVMPIRIFIKCTAETAYAYEPTYINNNSLNNRWLLGGGPGIDILLFNNFILSAEYNFNDLGEAGLFYKSSFNF